MTTKFVDTTTPLSAANLNSIDRGGNVSANAGGGLSIDITSCWYVKAAAPAVVNYAGASAQAVTDNQTNYVYILGSSGALVINTTGFPASYSATPYIPLAVVTTSGGVITSITDRRFMAFLP